MCQQKLVRPSPVEQTLVPKADAGPAQQNATTLALARVTPRATFLLRKRPKSASHHWITGKCNSFRIGRETCVNRSWSAPPGAQVSLGPSQGHPLGPGQGHTQGQFPFVQKTQVRLAPLHHGEMQ